MTQDFESAEWQRMIKKVLEMSQEPTEDRTAKLAAMSEVELAKSFVTTAALSDPTRTLDILEQAVLRATFSGEAFIEAVKFVPRAYLEQIVMTRLQSGLETAKIRVILDGLSGDEVQRLALLCVIPPSVTILADFFQQHLSPERRQEVEGWLDRNEV